MPLERVFLCLGSNLGDRLGYLQAAVMALENESGIEVVKASTAYESDARDMPPDTPAFVNAAVEIETTLGPHDLLRIIQDIERRLGRPDHGRSEYESRVIDVDIVLFGDRRISSAQLTVPHNALKDRRFFLQPLADLDPDLVIPETRQTVSERASELVSSQPLSPVAPPEEWVSADL